MSGAAARGEIRKTDTERAELHNNRAEISHIQETKNQRPKNNLRATEK
jgi:hypothetical protein